MYKVSNAKCNSFLRIRCVRQGARRPVCQKGSNRGFRAMKYKVYELIGENSISQKYGQQIYDLIYPQLQAGKAVELDFTGVRRFLSVFFNIAIGQLLRDIKPEHLDQLLVVSNLNPLGQQTYDNVIENAKRYYSDEQYRGAVDEMVLEQSAC